MKARAFLAVAVIVVLGAGCRNLLNQNSSSTSPTTVTTQLMGGSWASVSSATSLTNTCTDFHWMITSISEMTASGTFSATCMGTMQVNGTASGTLSGTTVTWTASGNGTTAGGAACPISLSGTATFDGTQFRIPFTGTTCMGPVSGTEILRKA